MKDYRIHGNTPWNLQGSLNSSMRNIILGTFRPNKTHVIESKRGRGQEEVSGEDSGGGDAIIKPIFLYNNVKKANNYKIKLQTTYFVQNIIYYVIYVTMSQLSSVLIYYTELSDGN